MRKQEYQYIDQYWYIDGGLWETNKNQYKPSFLAYAMRNKYNYMLVGRN